MRVTANVTARVRRSQSAEQPECRRVRVTVSQSSDSRECRSASEPINQSADEQEQRQVNVMRSVARSGYDDKPE